MIDGLAKQVALVEAAVRGNEPGVQVLGALCFVGAELRLLGTLTFNGYPLLYPKQLASRANRARPVDAARRKDLLEQLAARFPPA